MGALVIACYRPHPGRAEELDALVREHVPALRALGLVTARAPVAMRAADGSVLEIFEWISDEAAQHAHDVPEVRALWQRFETVCSWGRPGEVPGMGEFFPHFSPLEGS